MINGVARESKVGRVNLTESVRKQITSDAHLVESGVIKRAHWHFYPSDHTKQLGASEPVLDFLDEHGIKYTIHLPVAK